MPGDLGKELAFGLKVLTGSEHPDEGLPYIVDIFVRIDGKERLTAVYGGIY
jgi:hypothetical protein